MKVPELYTGRYLAVNGLGSSEQLVPVWVGYGEPVVPINSALEEVAETLVPSWETLLAGEWRPLSRSYWRQLTDAGIDRIAGELAEISARHSGRPLVLVGEDDLLKGHRDLRIVAAAWLEDHGAGPVYELTGDGRKLHYRELPKRVQPKRPKRHDRRWTHGKEPLSEWPLSEDDVRGWVRARHWQFARTAPHNPHEYTHRDWGDEQMFLRVIAHIREFGREQAYAGDIYTVYDLDDWFLWSMGDPSCVTVVLNRKYHDPEKRAQLASSRTGRSREELGLRIAREDQAVELGLFDREEERA